MLSGPRLSTQEALGEDSLPQTFSLTFNFPHKSISHRLYAYWLNLNSSMHGCSNREINFWSGGRPFHSSYFLPYVKPSQRWILQKISRYYRIPRTPWTYKHHLFLLTRYKWFSTDYSWQPIDSLCQMSKIRQLGRLVKEGYQGW